MLNLKMNHANIFQFKVGELDELKPAREKRQVESRACWDFCRTYPVGSARRGCLADCRRGDSMNYDGQLSPTIPMGPIDPGWPVDLLGAPSHQGELGPVATPGCNEPQRTHGEKGPLDNIRHPGHPGTSGPVEPPGAAWERLLHAIGRRTKRQVESRACYDFCRTYPVGSPRRGCLADCRRVDSLNSNGQLPPGILWIPS